MEECSAMIPTPHVEIEMKNKVSILMMRQDIGGHTFFLPTRKHDSYSEDVFFR